MQILLILARSTVIAYIVLHVLLIASETSEAEKRIQPSLSQRSKRLKTPESWFTAIKKFRL